VTIQSGAIVEGSIRADARAELNVDGEVSGEIERTDAY